MWYEIVNEVIRRIFQDKIVLALVAVAILGIVFGGIKLNEPSSRQNIAGNATGSTEPVEPALAASFVRWWLGRAFDCVPSSAPQNHQEAGNWMTDQANSDYNTIFWNNPLEKGILNGQIPAQFSVSEIAPLAINPDGSIVVGIKAQVSYQYSGTSTVEPLRTDFLVVRVPRGLRIAGIYNHPSAAITASQIQ